MAKTPRFSKRARQPANPPSKRHAEWQHNIPPPLPIWAPDRIPLVPMRAHALPWSREMACELAALGLAVREISRRLEINPNCLYKEIERNPAFAKEWHLARYEGVQLLFDDLLDAHKVRPEDVQAAKLASENIKWVLAKVDPAKYGERLDLHVHKKIDLAGAIAAGRKRAQLQRDEPVTVPILKERSREEAELFS